MEEEEQKVSTSHLPLHSVLRGVPSITSGVRPSLTCGRRCVLCYAMISGDASRYTDCDSCVAAGYGWSWEEEECGTFVNTDCRSPTEPGRHPQEEHSSSNYDSSISTDGDSASEAASPHSSASHATSGDDDDDFIADDEDDVPAGPKTFSWDDTEATTHIWSIINRGDYDAVSGLLERDPDVVRYRSKDGRGALWWAFEYGREEIADLLIAHGSDEDATDANGRKPREMAQPAHDDL